MIELSIGLRQFVMTFVAGLFVAGKKMPRFTIHLHYYNVITLLWLSRLTAFHKSFRKVACSMVAFLLCFTNSLHLLPKSVMSLVACLLNCDFL